MSRPNRLLAALALASTLIASSARADGLVDSLVRRFGESDFVFVRAKSNAPLPPMAWVTASGYQESEFRQVDGGPTDVTYQQTTFSQAALVPIPIGKRDAVAIGEWVSWTRFDLHGAARDDQEVLSVAIPLGWVRQASPSWQVAAFVAPLGHKTEHESWYWETLGGVFARNVTNDRFAWIVGAYFDVSPLEDFYTPYLGAAWIIDDRWTLNAIMPWPSVTYAPSTNTLWRLGISPSGTSWSVEEDERRPRMNMTTWNVGVAVERRLTGSLWLGFEAGVAALRGLSMVGSDWESPQTKLSNTGYALLTLNLRPGSVPGPR